jgi:manganese transport protein
MQDFVGFRIPMWVRRLVTMVPAVIVVAMGVEATQALVLSQVVLSLVLPVPMIALMVLIRRPSVMGRFAVGWGTYLPALAMTGLVLVLNVILLLQSCGILADLTTGN